MTGARFPHSEIPGSKSGCRLPEAYRRLPRPSSAPDAKASTVCPKKLEHQNDQTTKRCSRPLCSSQTTTSTTTQTPSTRREGRRPGNQKKQTTTPRSEPDNIELPTRGRKGPFPQDPTACPPGLRPRPLVPLRPRPTVLNEAIRRSDE